MEAKYKTPHREKHVEKLRQVTKEPDETFPKKSGVKAANKWEYGHHAKKTRSMTGCSGAEA